jgi:hypothetical protein
MYKFVVSDNYDNCEYFKTKQELEKALVGEMPSLEFEDESELSIYELGKQYQVVKNLKVVAV